MKASTILPVLFLVLSGCKSSTNEWRKGLEAEWLGKTEKELIAVKGTPFQINDEEIKDTKIYIYRHFDFTPDIPPNTYYEDFFVNSDSVIYKIETYKY